MRQGGRERERRVLEIKEEKKSYVRNRLNREEYKVKKQHRKKEMRQIKKEKEKE
jgi:hypothetical protein